MVANCFERGCAACTRLESGLFCSSPCATIRKTVSDLFMPVSGEILEMNNALEGDPELVNSDPYGKGWMIKVKMSDPSEVDALLSASDYQDLIG